MNPPAWSNHEISDERQDLGSRVSGHQRQIKPSNTFKSAVLVVVVAVLARGPASL